MQLNIFGEFFTRDGEKKRVAEVLHTVNENKMTQLDETTQDRIKTLMNAKDLAIKNEDYEKAKKIKVAIDQLKLIGAHLNQLEAQKNMAVASEDYDNAKIITSEILKLRNAISPESLLGNNVKSEKNILPPVKNPGKNSFGDIKGGPNEAMNRHLIKFILKLFFFYIIFFFFLIIIYFLICVYLFKFTLFFNFFSFFDYFLHFFLFLIFFSYVFFFYNNNFY